MKNLSLGGPTSRTYAAKIRRRRRRSFGRFCSKRPRAVYNNNIYFVRMPYHVTLHCSQPSMNDRNFSRGLRDTRRVRVCVYSYNLSLSLSVSSRRASETAGIPENTHLLLSAALGPILGIYTCNIISHCVQREIIIVSKVYVIHTRARAGVKY